jgi:hypothetical protein
MRGGNIVKSYTLIGVLCILLALLVASCNDFGDKEGKLNEVVNDLDNVKDRLEGELNKTTDVLDASPMPTRFQTNAEGNNYTQIKEGIKSPDGELEAKLIRENDKIYHSIIVMDKDGNHSKIDLENVMYTGTISFEWIDSTRIALLGYKNPSLEV